MKTKADFALTLLACLAIFGCQNTVNTLENEEKSAVSDPVANRRISTDAFLRDRLLFRSVKMTPNASGSMTVEVAATNIRTGFFAQIWSWMTNENPFPVDYKFTWQDARGMTVETTLSAWRTVRIAPGETVYFKAVAPAPQCKDFILNLKESN